ncbi:MAG: FHA domain-containing protein [Promicromonosporaceae bacterium]|nr:FHA domain-containing protein [Promicromonosporaceae bacterium]
MPETTPPGRDEPGTTHADYGDGDPRLLLGHDGWTWEDEPQTVFWLDREVTLIGSSPEADIQLEGIAPLHAEIRHDESDDYVLELHDEGKAPTVAGGHYVDRPGDQVLHHGASFRVGAWSLIFQRDEYADHGRPFGGREGGEGSEPLGQPPRPDYGQDHAEAAAREDDDRA